MGKGYFIVGTDTGVGKTIVAGGIAALYRDMDFNVGVMKPIATGCKSENASLLSEDAVFLKQAAETEDEYELINPVRFEQPLAPTIAAKLSKTRINLEEIRSAYDTLCKKHQFIIVEGIGGILVPISEYYFIIDLASEFEIPLIIVSRPSLGTINHTLLTVAYAREHGLDIKGIVFNNCTQTSNNIVRSNVEEIQRITSLPILGIVPFDKRLDKKSYQKETVTEIFRDNINKDIII